MNLRPGIRLATKSSRSTIVCGRIASNWIGPVARLILTDLSSCRIGELESVLKIQS